MIFDVVVCCFNVVFPSFAMHKAAPFVVLVHLSLMHAVHSLIKFWAFFLIIEELLTLLVHAVAPTLEVLYVESVQVCTGDALLDLYSLG